MSRFARGRRRALEGPRRPRPRQWDPAQVRYVDGLPVTDPARTIVVLPDTLPADEFRRLRVVLRYGRPVAVGRSSGEEAG